MQILPACTYAPLKDEHWRIIGDAIVFPYNNEAQAALKNLFQFGLEGHDLSKIPFADLPRITDKEHSPLIRARFTRCCLDKVSFPENSVLDGAEFIQSSLLGVQFQKADLNSAKFTSAHLDGANFDGARIEAAEFNLAQLEKTSFRGAHAKRAQFNRANLGHANFESAEIESAEFNNQAQLQNSCFKYAKLDGAQFNRANLTEANFEGARGEQTQWKGATLVKAHLNQTILNAADFTDADLQGAKFFKGELKGAKLHRARLLMASFEDTDLRDADLLLTNVRNTRFFRIAACGMNMEAVIGCESACVDESILSAKGLSTDLLRKGLFALEAKNPDLKKIMSQMSQVSSSSHQAGKMAAAPPLGPHAPSAQTLRPQAKSK